jgi:hypothetical protein
MGWCKEKFTVRSEDVKIEFTGNVRDYLSVSQS